MKECRSEGRIPVPPLLVRLDKPGHETVIGKLINVAPSSACIEGCALPMGNGVRVVFAPPGNAEFARQCSIVRSGFPNESWCAIKLDPPLTLDELKVLVTSAMTPAMDLPSVRNTLSDTPLNQDVDDLFDFRSYSKALSDIILNRYTDTPLTVAINAPWGAGKSSLGLMLLRGLQSAHATGQQPNITCWFNAWQNDDGTSLVPAIVSTIARTLDRHRPWYRRFLRPLPVGLLAPEDRVRARAARVLRWLVTGSGIAFLGLATWWLFSGKQQSFLQFAASCISGLAVSSLTILVAGSALDILSQPFSAVAAFVKNAANESTAGCVREVRKQLARLQQNVLPRNGRFIIFVDDLDRCQPEKAIGLLEAVDQLLTNQDVVTILMCDVESLAVCADIKYSELSRRCHSGGEANGAGPTSPLFGWRFLQRIIQLQFDLPGMLPVQMTEAIVKLCGQKPSVPAAPDPWWKRFRRYRRAKGTPGQTVHQRASVPTPAPKGIQQAIEDDGEEILQACGSSLRYLPLHPRNVKRLINRIRLLLLIASERNLFAGQPEVTVEEIGQWAVLQERWPRLAARISRHPDLMGDLEECTGDAEGFRQLIERLVPEHSSDTQLRQFCEAFRLSRVIRQLVLIQPMTQ